MLVGKTITDATIKTDYPDLEEKKYPEYLAKEALSQVSQGAFREEGIKTVNGLKHNYGNGISTKICMFNATGQTLTKLHEGSWHGRWYDGFDPSIWNGQCSAVLHVHSSGGVRGSTGYLVYRIENINLDVFIGWDTPFSGGPTNTFRVEMRKQDHWWNEGKENYMKELVENGWKSDIPNNQQDFSTTFFTEDKTKIDCTGHLEGTIDQESSSMLIVTLSLKDFKYPS